MEALLVTTISSLGTVVIVILLLIFFWDKVELFISRVLKILGGISKSFIYFRKKSIQHDLQSRINIFIKDLKKNVSDLETDRFAIHWIDDTTDRKSFIESGKVVLRLKDYDTEDDNFIHGTYMFVSTCLLFKVKHHLSPSQKESVDLFVTADIIRKEKNYIIDKFLENYLQPCLEKSEKNKKYYIKYESIHNHGYFYPVLINELDFLGKKVFASISKAILVNEFDEIIEFLFSSSARCIGDDYANLEYLGEHTRIVIFIIGKPEKIADEERYEYFLKQKLGRNKIEGIYAVGDVKNKEIIDRICSHNDGLYDVVKNGESAALLNRRDGTTKCIQQYFVILRKKEQTPVL
jgi:hypothetical protein